MVALFLLVFGFSTPFWVLIAVETDFNSEPFDVVEMEYIGLWQWCFKHNGCFDLSLLAKESSIYTKIINKRNRNEILDMIINKDNRTISPVLLICLVAFGAAIRTFDEPKMDMLLESNILRVIDINRYFSFWMVCIATLLYFSNGMLAIVSLCRGFVINTNSASERRSVAATRSGNEKSLEMISVYNF
ncbi:unnamed protein product [Mytilus coruscus]|uniref:Claudin n=1 Tax=Mytilus coruscus TaxID=42192 RepID=A0A6J8AT45_MYTCO|nr:unnamed protein product [Mytilus coruscus]